MARTRALASEALMMRQKAGVNLSQPLASLAIPGELSRTLTQLLAEEVNVESIEMNAPILTLVTERTPELIQKGDERLYARAVAQARKTHGFLQTDIVRVLEDSTGTYSVMLSTGEQRFNLIATHEA